MNLIAESKTLFVLGQWSSETVDPQRIACHLKKNLKTFVTLPLFHLQTPVVLLLLKDNC